jgi:hypothetical protein
MKIREFIREGVEDQDIGGGSELEVHDGASNRGDSVLATALDQQRNAPENQAHEDPKVAATAIIQFMRSNGYPQFNDAALEKIKSNGALGNIINKIETDEDGVKWVHLNKPEGVAPENDEQQPGDAIADAGPDQEQKQKTVGNMAKRALDKHGM